VSSLPETHGSTPGGSDIISPADSLSPYFVGQVLDTDRRLLDESYRLRYQVYCLERRFLSPDPYPDQMETDVYDPYSVHIGVVNLQSELAATTRLVQQSEAGQPMFDHCTIFPGTSIRDDETRKIVEISRLSVSRRYNRRAGDDFYSLQGLTGRTDGPERRRNGELVMTLYKAVYQASKRRGFTHWLAATEKSLQRLIARYGFPFRPIGPETDYFGSVTPYLLDLQEFDAVILSGRIPLLQEFLIGLEPEFRPVAADTSHRPIA
jgi:N-acyl amino acid synthase of PEP-CTERM/exosortase system